MRSAVIAIVIGSLIPLAVMATDGPDLATDGTPSKPTKPSFPSSGDSYGPGDAIIPQVCIPEFTFTKPQNDVDIVKYSAPPDGHAKIADTNGQELAAYAPTENGKKKSEKNPGKVIFWIDTKPESDGTMQGHFVMSEHWYSLHGIEGQLVDCNGGKQGIKLNTKYFINTGVLDTYGTSRRGVTYGALTIPYKWHSTDHSIDAAPTVGAFVGGYIANPGVAIALVGSAGIGAVPVPTTKDGKTSNDLKTSLSLAAGPVVTLTRGQRFQLGFLIGTDWVGAGSKADYKYNGKLWFALSLGVDLTK